MNKLIQDLKDYAVVNNSMLVMRAALELENLYSIVDDIASLQPKYSQEEDIGQFS